MEIVPLGVGSAFAKTLNNTNFLIRPDEGEPFLLDCGFTAARARGARPQRALWASTSTKNPSYSDVLYVDELVGPNTVNTIPPATIDAFRDHGTVDAHALTTDVDEAERHFEALAALGVDIDAITEELQVEGVDAFADAFNGLLETIEAQRDDS